jgi:hypothetical protein
MKRAAFYLVASVISIQLFIVAGVLYGCFRTGDEKCTGDKAGELMMYITAQSFALYAAEK